MRTNQTIDGKVNRAGFGRKALTAAALIGAMALPIKGYTDVINGVNYDENGRSDVVLSDDGSYGILVDNKVDNNGNVRILEYANVSDSNFTRDSFTLNTDYTFNPLNQKLIGEGMVLDVDEANALYEGGLTSGGVLNSGTGWSISNLDNGTDSIGNNGDYIFGNPQWKIPVEGNYAVRERNLNAANIADNSSASIVDGILMNQNLQSYLQVMFDKTGNGVNLTSYDPSNLSMNSNGVNDEGIQVVPEPMTIGMLGLGGLLTLAGRRIKESYKRY